MKKTFTQASKDNAENMRAMLKARDIERKKSRESKKEARAIAFAE